MQVRKYMYACVSTCILDLKLDDALRQDGMLQEWPEVLKKALLWKSRKWAVFVLLFPGPKVDTNTAARHVIGSCREMTPPPWLGGPGQVRIQDFGQGQQSFDPKGLEPTICSK